MRTYRSFNYRDANFRIACREFDAVTETIRRQRHILESFIEKHPEFAASFEPLPFYKDAPDVARRMYHAGEAVGVGPMAAVAGVMAQLAAEAGLAAGADEAIVENGGDIYLALTGKCTVGLYSGPASEGNRLAFEITPDMSPAAICSSSGKMGRSDSLGCCDLATVVAEDAGIADAAATRAANLVKRVDDISATLNIINAIDGVDGVLIVKDDRIGLAGNLPTLVKGAGDQRETVARC